MAGRVTVVNFVSLDGVIQSPLSADEDRDGDFEHGGCAAAYDDSAVADFMRDSTVGAGGMLLGRRSYEILAAAWADADDNEPAVAAMNAMPKYVVSRTASAADLSWANSRLLDGDLPTAVAAARAAVDGDLVVFGSGRLVASLAEHDLVEEYRLLLYPVLLGAGKRMFDGTSARAGFDLVAVDTGPTGVVVLTYRRGAT